MDCFAEPVIGRPFARPVGFIRATNFRHVSKNPPSTVTTLPVM
jgi:hypothetical protein